jgi:hypothetical protein
MDPELPFSNDRIKLCGGPNGFVPPGHKVPIRIILRLRIKRHPEATTGNINIFILFVFLVLIIFMVFLFI